MLSTPPTPGHQVSSSQGLGVWSQSTLCLTLAGILGMGAVGCSDPSLGVPMSPVEGGVEGREESRSPCLVGPIQPPFSGCSRKAPLSSWPASGLRRRWRKKASAAPMSCRSSMQMRLAGPRLSTCSARCSLWRELWGGGCRSVLRAGCGLSLWLPLLTTLGSRGCVCILSWGSHAHIDGPCLPMGPHM